MNEFIKKEWFKIIMLILVSGFLFLCIISVNIQYQNYLAEKKCKNYENFQKMEKDENVSEMMDCVLKFPSLGESYYKEGIKNTIIKKAQEQIQDKN